MGNFFVNYQLWNAGTAEVAQVLQDVVETRAYVSLKKQNWVTVYDESSENQDEQKLHKLARELSTSLSTVIFAFLIHDSDVLIYFLYDCGHCVDEYYSSPDYFGTGDLARKEQLTGKPKMLLPYCQPETSIEAIAHTLQSRYTFAETRLMDLAKLLGMDESRVCSGFTNFDEELKEEKQTNEFQLVVRQELLLPEIQPEQFFRSAKVGDLETLQTLLDTGIDPNLQDEQGLTGITYAAARGHFLIVQALIAAGAQISPEITVGNTPLIAAAAAGHLQIVRTLIKAGADINVRNRQINRLLVIVNLRN